MVRLDFGGQLRRMQVKLGEDDIGELDSAGTSSPAHSAYWSERQGDLEDDRHRHHQHGKLAGKRRKAGCLSDVPADLSVSSTPGTIVVSHLVRDVLAVH